MAQSVQQSATGSTAGFRFPAEAKLSLLHSVQTVSRAHTGSYSMGTGSKATRS